jgi:hypothetical protein
MWKKVLVIAAIAAAITALIWLIKQLSSSSSGDHDLEGCLGIAEGRIEPGSVGRVRVTDKNGDPVILSARLDENVPGVVAKGTEIVVVSNGHGSDPALVSLVELSGDQG